MADARIHLGAQETDLIGISMRILFITRNFPPRTGGMEQYSWNLYRQLKQHTEVDLIANKRGKSFLPLFLLRLFLVLASRSHRYTHIHFGDGVLAVVATWAKLVSRARITITLHALDVTYDNSIYQTLIRFSLKRLDGAVCVSHYTRNECVARGVPEEKCRVIPNGLDLAELPMADTGRMTELVTEYELENKRVLLAVGRLIRRKGIRWFVNEVMPAMPREYVLLIAGDGPEKHAIESAVTEQDLSRRAVLLGAVDSRTKACLYSLAEIFVMPNIQLDGDSEGFGISIIEAGSYGTPCIGARLQGIPDAVIEGKTGSLVTAEDAAGFKHAIQGARFDRATVSETVRQHYDWSKLIADYMEFFSAR